MAVRIVPIGDCGSDRHDVDHLESLMHANVNIGPRADFHCSCSPFKHGIKLFAHGRREWADCSSKPANLALLALQILVFDQPQKIQARATDLISFPFGNLGTIPIIVASSIDHGWWTSNTGENLAGPVADGFAHAL